MTKIICFLNCLAHWSKSFCHHLMFGVCELLTFQSSPETGWPIGTTFAEIMFRRSFTKVNISFWLDSKHGCHWHSCFWMTSMQKKVFTSDTTLPIGTKLCWNDVWMVLYKNSSFPYEQKSSENIWQITVKLCRNDIWKVLYKNSFFFLFFFFNGTKTMAVIGNYAF